jgi:hypothetical protein
MDEPLKTVELLMADLRKDVGAWQTKLAPLRGRPEYADLVQRIEEWIGEAERVLARWGA